MFHINGPLPKLRSALQYLRLCNTSTTLAKSEAIEQLQLDEFSDSLVKRKRKTRSPYNLNEELRSHFFGPEKEALLAMFPEKLRRKKRKAPDHLYLADMETATTIAKHFLQDYNGDIPLVEVNPGPGLLTKEILKQQNVTNLRLFESHREFIPALEAEFEAKNPKRVNLKQGDLLGMWRIAHQDKMDNGKRVETFLFGLPQTDWDAAVNMRLFACVGSLNFFKHIIDSVVFQNGLMALGRCEFYLVIPPPIYIHLTCDNSAGYMLYRATTMLFQIMFTHEFIAKLPRKSFLPFQSKYDMSKNNKLARVYVVDPEFLYFVRIVPRRNLFRLCLPNQIQGLWYFVKQNCISRKNRIIPNLEKWVPGCGIQLIVNRLPPQPAVPIQDRGFAEPPAQLCTKTMQISKTDYFNPINLFSQFGDLTPSQMLTLYLQFISWPGFKRSSFQVSMESSLLKMETSSESLINDNAFQEQVEDETEAEVQPVESNTDKAV